MIIVKVGGGESLNLKGVIADLAQMEQPYMVVHGANALRDRIAAQMGYDKQVITSLSGYSSVLSDATALDSILMAYSGLRNKRLVELCQQQGINAVGLTGLDGRIVQGKRNRGIRVEENGKKMIKRDFSGKPQSINSALLKLLLDNGYVPVLTIPIADETGTAINSENDDIVCALQKALDARVVLQLIEAPGLMEDIDDPGSLQARLSREQLAVREEQAQGRIKRKLHALNKLARSTVETIVISDGRIEHPVRDALAGAGTWVQ